MASRGRDGNRVQWTGRHPFSTSVTYLPHFSGTKTGVDFLMDVIGKDALMLRFGPAVQQQLRDKRGTFPSFKTLFKAKFRQDSAWGALRAQIGAPPVVSEPSTQGSAVDIVAVLGISRSVPFYRDRAVLDKEQHSAQAVLVLCNQYTSYNKDGLANLLYSAQGNDTTALYIGRLVEVNMHVDALVKEGQLKQHKAVVIPLHIEPGSHKRY